MNNQEEVRERMGDDNVAKAREMVVRAAELRSKISEQMEISRKAKTLADRYSREAERLERGAMEVIRR